MPGAIKGPTPLPTTITGSMAKTTAAPTEGTPRGRTGIVMMNLGGPATLDEVRSAYRDAYAGEPLVSVQDEAPWVSHIAGRHGAEVGGFTLSADGRRLVVVATLDNLLKGAATQALQNLNLAFGLPETLGIPT